MRMEPKEVLLPESARAQAPIKQMMKGFPSALYSPLPEGVFDDGQAQERLQAFGLPLPEGKNEALKAVGAVLFYVQETQKARPGPLSRLDFYRVHDYMVLDETTRKNLELFENLQTRSRKGSLLDVLDRTVTSMGGRLLKRALSFPLMNLEIINERLDSVAELKEKDLARQNLRETLRQVKDVERLASRVSLRIANARDLVALRSSLALLPEFRSLLSVMEGPGFKARLNELDELPDIRDLLERAIEDNPPATIKEGGLIRKGFDPALDRLRGVSHEGKRWIAELEAKERLRTGISSLKVRYNRVFSYYIEVTKTNLPAVPPHYIRKQTLANSERFITQELQEDETQVLSAEEEKEVLQHQIFLQILGQIAAAVPKIQRTAHVLAEVDMLSALAEVAEHNGYCRPKLEEGDGRKIMEGRHPVLERMALGERFVPNDLVMDAEERQILIITGPNMAGKSTILRQAALIVIMAQIGNFVPAKEAHVGLVDRGFP